MDSCDLDPTFSVELSGKGSSKHPFLGGSSGPGSGSSVCISHVLEAQTVGLLTTLETIILGYSLVSPFPLPTPNHLVHLCHMFCLCSICCSWLPLLMLAFYCCENTPEKIDVNGKRFILVSSQVVCGLMVLLLWGL